MPKPTASNPVFTGNSCSFRFCASTGNTANITLTVQGSAVAGDIYWSTAETAAERNEADEFVTSFLSGISGGRRSLTMFSVVEQDDDKRQQMLARFLKADSQ